MMRSGYRDRERVRERENQRPQGPQGRDQSQRQLGNSFLGKGEGSTEEPHIFICSTGAPVVAPGRPRRPVVRVRQTSPPPLNPKRLDAVSFKLFVSPGAFHPRAHTQLRGELKVQCYCLPGMLGGAVPIETMPTDHNDVS